MTTHPFKLVSTLHDPVPPKFLTEVEALELLSPIYGEVHARDGLRNILSGTTACMSVDAAMIEVADELRELNGVDQALKRARVQHVSQLPRDQVIDELVASRDLAVLNYLAAIKALRAAGVVVADGLRACAVAQD